MAPKTSRDGSLLNFFNLIRLRKTIQYLMLALFVLLFFLGRGIYQNTALQGNQAPAYLHLFLQFDPLTMIAQLLSNRMVLAGLLPAIVIVILTGLTGRSWCGWICPLGTTLDIANFRGKKNNKSQVPENFRKVKYIILLLILFAALFGNLSLLIFDPLTILYRTLSVSAIPALDNIISAIENGLYQVPFLQNAITTLDSFLRPSVLPVNPLYFRDSFLFLGIFIFILGLNFFAPRFWCRYLCSLGGLLGLVSKISIFRRTVKPDCIECGLCQPSCPVGTIDPLKDYSSDPSECTMCMECFASCPRSVTTVSPVYKPAALSSYDPNRRDFISTFAASALLTGVVHGRLPGNKPDPHNLRPPGTTNEGILSRCIRCGACMRACPTGALQPAMHEAGVEGLWTPILIPSLGFCDYTCNACGQICPVEAIPPLDLPEKQVQVIGNAYVNRDRCLAWSDHTPCIVCEEMCPVPEKAIQLQDVEYMDNEGKTTTISAPYVIRDRCIGCGICENRCPVNGEAAIRVYTANTK